MKKEEEEEKARKSLEMNGCYCSSSNFASLSLSLSVLIQLQASRDFSPFSFSSSHCSLFLSRSLAPSLADQTKTRSPSFFSCVRRLLNTLLDRPIINLGSILLLGPSPTKNLLTYPFQKLIPYSINNISKSYRVQQ